MSPLVNTVDIERSLLRQVLSGKYSTRMFLSRVKPSYMTSRPRSFILAAAVDLWKLSSAFLSFPVFQVEVANKIDDEAQREVYFSEWALIQAQPATDDIEALFAVLEREERRAEAVEILEEAGKLLLKGDVEEGIKLLKRETVKIGVKGQDIPIGRLSDYAVRKEHYLLTREHPERYAGIKTGLPRFDFITGGLHTGEMTVISAISGVGKSTFMKAVCVNIAVLSGINVLHVTNEENFGQVMRKYDALTVRMDSNKFKRGTFTDEELQKWVNAMETLGSRRFGQVYVKEVAAFTTVLEAERAFYELQQQGVKIGLIVYDYLDNVNPIQQAYNENHERAKVSAEMKELARSLDIPVLTATQAATALEEKTEKGKSSSKMDVYGSKRTVHNANTLVIIKQEYRDNKQTCEEYERDWIWEMAIKKNRDGGEVAFKVRHCVTTGEIYQVGKDGGKENENAIPKVLEDERVKRSRVIRKAVSALKGPVRVPVIARVPVLEEQP